MSSGSFQDAGAHWEGLGCLHCQQNRDLWKSVVWGAQDSRLTDTAHIGIKRMAPQSLSFT